MLIFDTLLLLLSSALHHLSLVLFEHSGCTRRSSSITLLLYQLMEKEQSNLPIYSPLLLCIVVILAQYFHNYNYYFV